MKETILIVAAHPDDELLGCGGTVYKHTQNGDTVHSLILSEGATSRQIERNRSLINNELTNLKDSALKAANILGVESIELQNYPDNRLDSVDRLEIIKAIKTKVDKIKPSTIYTHHYGDVNIDHQIICESVMTACRPMPGCEVKKILTFWIVEKF